MTTTHLILGLLIALCIIYYIAYKMIKKKPTETLKLIKTSNGYTAVFQDKGKVTNVIKIHE